MPDSRKIHVVAFDVPFPPDYGGVIDVYYRCKQLKEAGYRITLHCYEYGRGQRHDHSAIADKVYYYKRQKRLNDWFSRLPFIVQTRRNPLLLKRLLTDKNPILFEGQHTTYYLDHPKLKVRRKCVRQHNIEWQYYEGLAERATSPMKKWYYRSEARKLKQQEKILEHANLIACISEYDFAYYRQRFKNVELIPVAFDHQPEIYPALKHTPFLLFHGNLSVAENSEAVIWLLNALRNETAHPNIIIAGKNPCPVVQSACSENPLVELVANPTDIQMQQLIQAADAHLIIGFQQSGIKLKLLNALVSGKPCIATPEIVAGSGLENQCILIRNEQEFIREIRRIRHLSEEEIGERRELIQEKFSGKILLEMIDRYLFPKA